MSRPAARPGRTRSGRSPSSAPASSAAAGRPTSCGAAYDVVAWDPGPDAAERLSGLAGHRLAVAGAARAAPRAPAADRLRFAETLEEALAGADFVQESSPEVLAAKVALLADDRRGGRPGRRGRLEHVRASDDRHGGRSARRPGRFVVGHPFNPPYLIPLVEVVGGAADRPDGRDLGRGVLHAAPARSCLTMEQEVPGFVGNRLQEALWREALHMVDSGRGDRRSRSTTRSPTAPGCAGRSMGPILTFHLAGGPGGMAHMLDHFGPRCWSRGPGSTRRELTPSCATAWSPAPRGGGRGRRVAELERRRDAFLVDLLLLLERHRTGRPSMAGAAAPYRARTATEVREEWIDYNGHLHDASYAIVLERRQRGAASRTSA